MMREALESIVAAVESGRTDIVKTIIAACGKCEIEDEGDISVSKLLNSLSTPVGTVLHLSVKLEQADVVRTLLAAGADPGVQNQDGQTALELATTSQVYDVFSQELLQCTAQSNIGRVCQLIAAGVNVNMLDSPTHRNNPLHWAASYGNKDMVQCLCKRGAVVNSQNADGATPLHDAVSRGDMGIIGELLDSGASVDIKPTQGKYYDKSVLDIAAEKPELMVVLQRHGMAPITNGNLEDSLSDIDGPTSLGRQSSLASNDKIDSQTPNGPIPPSLPQIGDYAEVHFPEKMSGIMRVSDPPQPLVTDSRLHYLWPRPQRVLQKEGSPFTVDGSLPIYLIPASKPDVNLAAMGVWQTLADKFELLSLTLHIECNLPPTSLESPCVTCEVNRRLFKLDESYRIAVNEKQIKIQASDQSGLFYAVNTLLQLFNLCGKEGLQQVQIHDWPTLRDRGVLLDMSKGRIPSLETMRNVLQILAAMKINQVHLYMRFKSFKNSIEVSSWQFPYPAGSLLELEQFCRKLHITLVPVVDVTPHVTYDELDSLKHTFQQFVNCFTSTTLVAVGPRLSGLLADITDEGEIHLDDVHRLLPLKSHQVLQLCGFVFHDNQGALQQFPDNTMLVEYGFQATYDFQKHCQVYAESGVPFCVMPGTAAWNSLAGCPEAAVSNIYNAVHNVLSHNGLGLIVAHWAGIGHITHQSLSWPGFVVAAGLSWNSSVHWDFLHANLAELVNKHVLRDEGEITGQVMIELGRAETYLLRCARNQPGSDHSNLPAEKGTTLYQFLSHPDQVALENLTGDVFQKAMRHIRKCQAELSRARLLCPQGILIVKEISLTADLMLSACRVGRVLVVAGKNPSGHTGYATVNLGVSNLPPTHKTDLANRVLSQIDNYRSVWLGRQLPQGLQDSLIVLSTMLKQFLPEHAEGQQASDQEIHQLLIDQSPLAKLHVTSQA